MICKKEHRYDDRLLDLPDSQAGTGRHKCPGCAYERGYAHGSAGTGRNFDGDSLDESQAGAGRHKSAEDAYILGYVDGAVAARKKK